MADNCGSTERGLGNRCTPMLVIGDSREATTSSDCTPQLVLTTAFSNVEPSEPSEPESEPEPAPECTGEVGLPEPGEYTEQTRFLYRF